VPERAKGGAPIWALPTPLTLAPMLTEMPWVIYLAEGDGMLPLLIAMPRLFERLLQRLMGASDAALTVGWGVSAVTSASMARCFRSQTW